MQHPFRLGDNYHVEPSLNRVTGPKGATRLEPKVMGVLVCLAGRPGQVVRKERLLEAAWPDTAVGDDVLTRAISELRRLFEDDAKQPLVIETIPKSGYRLVASIVLDADAHAGLVTAPEAAGAAAPAPADDRKVALRGWRRRPGLIAVAATGIVLAALAGTWPWRTAGTHISPEMRVVPLTTSSGSEFGTLSPDGRQLAFAWNGEVPSGDVRHWWQGDWDIYVKLLGSSEVRPLTKGPGRDLAPAWSPDGREIAYVRTEAPDNTPRLRIVSALGGSDRLVSDLRILLPAVWSPDGRYLVACHVPEGGKESGHGLSLIPVRGGAPRAITQPRAQGLHHVPALSPDGRRLAYIACGEDGEWGCEVQVVDLDASYSVVGSPRKLTQRLAMFKSALAWSSDGQSIVYNAADLVLQVDYLWRVGADGHRPPERIEVAGMNALFPSIAAGVLAFARLLHDEDIYRFEPGRPVQPVAQSSMVEMQPAFSPDGRRLAFCSARSGDALEVWVANADGSDPKQLTHGPERLQCSPAWSPDGQQVAFHSSTVDGHPHIWTVDREGGTPRQITRESGDQMDPTWSHDGEWIYFSWSRSTDRDIWRTRVRTGSMERVTRGGGFVARESADGTTLLYISKDTDSPVMAQPLAGGPPRVIIECVVGTAFTVVGPSIYYMPCPGSATGRHPNPPVQVLNVLTGTHRDVGSLERFYYDSLPSGFAVSPDGRTILYSRLVRDETDLMLIENFR